MIGYIQLAFECLAFIVAAILFNALRRSGWLLWIPFLLYTCIVEIWGTYIQEFCVDINNAWLYNPYIIISTAFYGRFLIRSSILKRSVKNICYTFLFAVVALVGVWYLVWGDRRELLSPFVNGSALIICLGCLLFYYSQIKNPVEYGALTQVPEFWIVSALLIFYAGITVYMAGYSFLAAAKIKIMQVYIQNLIPQVLSLLLYSAIIFSFLRCRYQLKIS